MAALADPLTLEMFDSVDPSQIPASAVAVAGYVGGNWPDYAREVQLFPHAHHLSIAVNASEDADCLDVERGDATPEQAPAWVKRQAARGVKRPVVYSSLDNKPAVLQALTSAGATRDQYRVWTAHYTDVSHVEPGSDATQWTDHALGRDLDESTVLTTFFEATVPVVNPPHYDWFQTGPFPWGIFKINERAAVERYDRLRRRPRLNALQLAFLRGELQFLAERIAREALFDGQGRRYKTPHWSVARRGWRYQQLIHRARNQRFV